MSKDISLKSIDIKSLIPKLTKKYGRHAVFGVVILILLSYLLVAFKISQLAKAEPDPGQEADVSATIPKIDPDAIDQIQKLEQNNTDIHSLFDAARNNPFQE